GLFLSACWWWKTETSRGTRETYGISSIPPAQWTSFAWRHRFPTCRPLTLLHRSWCRQRSSPKVCNERFLKPRRWHALSSYRILERVPTWFSQHRLSPKAGSQGYAFMPVTTRPWL